jgi:hypothetical protein
MKVDLSDGRIDVGVQKILNHVDRESHWPLCGRSLDGCSYIVISFGKDAFSNNLEELEKKDLPSPKYLQAMDVVFYGPAVFEFVSCVETLTLSHACTSYTLIEINFDFRSDPFLAKWIPCTSSLRAVSATRILCRSRIMARTLVYSARTCESSSLRLELEVGRRVFIFLPNDTRCL